MTGFASNQSRAVEFVSAMAIIIGRRTANGPNTSLERRRKKTSCKLQYTVPKSPNMSQDPDNFIPWLIFGLVLMTILTAAIVLS